MKLTLDVELIFWRIEKDGNKGCEVMLRYRGKRDRDFIHHEYYKAKSLEEAVTWLTSRLEEAKEPSSGGSRREQE